jgi:protoporphyrinogen oxidase
MSEARSKTVVIIGAGPAGLTAAFELLTKSTEYRPILLEADDVVGGISRTVNYRGNRMDMGGHRFFSKSDRVMAWWQAMMSTDFLTRQRLSRILFMRRFFDYPVTLSGQTIINLGPVRMVRIGVSYLRARLSPRRDERSLEDFFINRFGRELYLTFFKDYTEKVWGVACAAIPAEWGAQRVKGLSVAKAVLHFLGRPFRRRASLGQKDVETSLIDKFLYPKFGPGQMWEETARRVRELGGELRLGCQVTGLELKDGSIRSVTYLDRATGENITLAGDSFISTMPVRELIAGFGAAVQNDVREVAEGLTYRDFITVGLLVNRMKISAPAPLAPDNWIYIQEPDVKLGRLQIFNNWSPYLVKEPGTVWLGLEYFCNEGDALWTMADADFVAFAADELAKIGVIDAAEVMDGTVVRVKKAYPAYFGSYGRFSVIRDFTDGIANLYLVGRNGMHRYNNQDHSMLTAMTAVENLMAGNPSRANIWDVNTEKDYHEEK